MKKFISIILSLMIVSSLCACAKESGVGNDEIVRKWKLSYFTIGDERTEGIGLPAEPHISFDDDSVTFTNNNKVHKGTWIKLDDGTYKIELDDTKIPTEASIDGDVLTVTMHGKRNEIVYIFISGN